MATKKITDEVVSEEVVAKVEEKKDPWKTLVTVQIPRANDGDSNYLFVSLNNRNYKMANIYNPVGVFRNNPSIWNPGWKGLPGRRRLDNHWISRATLGK